MTIVQLSDPHVREPGVLAYGQIDTSAYLARAVDALNRFAPRPELVVVSGDATDLGTEPETRTARAELDRLVCPYVVVPGNHDDPKVMHAVFRDYAFAAAGDGDVGFNWRTKAGGVQVIGLDSTVPGQAHGVLGPARRAWLDAALSAAAPDPTMVVLHHPPFAVGIAHMDRQNLHDADAFYDVLSRHPHVRHVGCGHVHRAVETCIRGIPTSIAPGPAHAVAFDTRPEAPPRFRLEPPAVRVFRLTGAQLVSHVVYLDDYPGPFPFFDEAGRLIGES